MKVITSSNGGLLSAVLFLLFVPSHNSQSQVRRLDQPGPSLQSITRTDSVFDKTILQLVDHVSGKDIRSLIDTLASDSFEGRATGSIGFDKAAHFVAQHFEQSGVIPLGNSYFQKFKIESRTVKSKVFIQNTPSDSIETMNVIGVKPGTTNPDEYVLVTAHLDHLGKTLDSIYPGANDNASGVAVMMTVAEILKNVNTSRSVVFIAFTGEEVGLMGSAFFVTHPPIDLKKIKFMINLDLVGSGSNGIMVQGVDGHDTELAEIKRINQTYFQFEIGTRPNSPNSDQYYFHLLGVPAFFLYAYNGTMPYHSPGDTAEKIDAAVVENVAKFVLMNVWNFTKKGR
ncbi:M28 family peptidase [bacterium]|nr:M28 family peptidase [bacterium]